MSLFVEVVTKMITIDRWQSLLLSGL